MLYSSYSIWFLLYVLQWRICYLIQLLYCKLRKDLYMDGMCISFCGGHALYALLEICSGRRHCVLYTMKPPMKDSPNKEHPLNKIFF